MRREASGRERGECETSLDPDIKQGLPGEYIVCQCTLSDTEHYIAVQYVCACVQPRGLDQGEDQVRPESHAQLIRRCRTLFFSFFNREYIDVNH